LREVIIYLILLDAVLLLCGVYLNEAANFGISKYIPPQFSKNSSYRWYVHHFVFEKYIARKYKLMYLISIYILSTFILMMSLTLYIFEQNIPAAIFLVMFVGSILGLARYTIKYLKSF